jgi:hypothetical protein
VTLSPAADALFPPAGLTDGRLGDTTKFSAAGAATITADLGQATNGDMEGTFPGTNWSNASTGTGTAAQSGTFKRGGASSAKVNGGASGVGIYRHIRQLRTGFRYRAVVYGRDTTSATCKLRIFNPETRNYLQASGGAWSAASADVASTATTSFVAMNTNFTVEGFKTCGRREYVTIYFDLVNTQNEDVYFDDFDFWPEWDFGAVFGHNFDSALAPELRSSTDNFSGSNVLVATMSPKRPAFYSKLGASVTSQFVRLNLPSANGRGIASLGELFAYQYLAPRRGMSATSGSATVSTEQPQIEAGDQVFILSDEERPTLEVPLLGLVTADYEEIRDEILARSAGSGYPMVIVPDDVDDPDLIVFGRRPSMATLRRADGRQMRDTTLVIRGLPYATVVG